MAQALKAAPIGAALKDLIVQILDENQTMAIATLRPDGWPQNTTVGFVHDDLALFFVVAQGSQKARNLALDPRASIAIGHHGSDAMGARGLSMAVRVDVVAGAEDIRRLNVLIWERYPNIAVFAPREANSVVLRAKPKLISVVDDAFGLAAPVTFEVNAQADLVPHRASS